MSISSTGYWIGHDVGHYHDEPLADELIALFAGHSVLDMGCGDAWYVGRFLQAGIDAFGVDGNPETSAWPDARHGHVLVADLSAPCRIDAREWVMSLEVGEHVPAEYADAFLDNLCESAKKGIVLSWAVPGQNGHGHVNEQANGYVVQKMLERGWHNDQQMETKLRLSSTVGWFKNTLMVFRP